MFAPLVANAESRDAHYLLTCCCLATTTSRGQWPSSSRPIDYPAIGMRAQVGRRSWAQGPPFATRLPISYTYALCGRWGDACQRTPPLVPRLGLPGGREPGGGTHTAGRRRSGARGCALFFGAQEPRWHSPSDCRSANITTASTSTTRRTGGCCAGDLPDVRRTGGQTRSSGCRDRHVRSH